MTTCEPEVLTDPVNRALTISCGAALSHLQISIRHFGYAYKVEPFLDSSNKDLLSRVIVYDRKEPITEEPSLKQLLSAEQTDSNLKIENWKNCNT